MIDPKKLDVVGRICHEANKLYCEYLGDFSQVSWDDSPEWLKQSVRVGITFNFLHPTASPEESHETWKIVKLEAGWSYGPVKDSNEKTHPNMVPYSMLPIEQQTKDHLFKSIVNAMHKFLEEPK